MPRRCTRGRGGHCGAASSLGWLSSSELEKNLEFIGPGDADFPFGEHEGQRAVPFGPALVEVANDHFNFMTAESAAAPNGDKETLVHVSITSRP